MNPGLPSLSIKNLHVHLAEREVLHGLSLELCTGDIYGLLGSNGAGKTTLIRTICGRIKPIAGSITISGHSGKKALSHIGLVPQELALYTHLTARENLVVFGRLSGLSASKVDLAINWASEATDIRTRLDERVGILSGGWKRRVNIAAAILHRPTLLVLDEPTVGVDIEARNSLHEVVINLSQAGMGVILATHDLEQAQTICTRVGFLHGGRIALEGPPRRLLTDAFNGSKEIVLELWKHATEDQRLHLEAHGFITIDGGYTWAASDFRGPIENLHTALRQLGMEHREIKLREPGLNSLFVKVMRDRELVV